jgi:lysophospholipase L1-like esterase
MGDPGRRRAGAKGDGERTTAPGTDGVQPRFGAACCALRVAAPPVGVGPCHATLLGSPVRTVATPPPPPTLLARLGWLSLGVLLTLGAAEAGLRLAGAALQSPEPADDGALTVLCEGDSFTYGVGGSAFPDQLEELLDADGDRWRVVNKGIPGYTSRHIVERLAADFETYKPDVLIVTTGENNRWNSVRLTDVQAGPLHTLDRLLMHARVYKLLKVAAIGWSHPTFHEWAESGSRAGDGGAPDRIGDVRERVGLPTPGDELAPPVLPDGAVPLYEEGTRLQLAGDYAAAAAVFGQMRARWPAEPYPAFAEGGALLRAGRRAEALDVLRAGRDALPPPDPARPDPQAAHDLLLLLGQALREDGDTAGAAAAWIDALRRYPDDPNLFLLTTDALQAGQGDPWAALAATGDIPGIEHNPMRDWLLQLHAAAPAADAAGMDALVAAGLQADAAKIAAFARSRGVPVVFTSYPQFAYPPVEAAAAEADAPYLDFRPVFAALFRSKDEFLSSDGCHANTEGYRVMAGALAGWVRHLVDGAPRPGDPLDAGRAALEAFRASYDGPPEARLEPPATAEAMVDELEVRRVCGAVKQRLEAIGGEDLSTAVGHRLRLRYSPAEMISMCKRFEGVSDDAMMDELRASLELDKAGL